MRYKKIILLITINVNLLYDYNYASLKKHDQLLKRHKKKKRDLAVSIEKLHEEWKDEYIELQVHATNNDSPLLQRSPQNSSEKSSLESFYEQELTTPKKTQ